MVKQNSGLLKLTVWLMLPYLLILAVFKLGPTIYWNRRSGEIIRKKRHGKPAVIASAAEEREFRRTPPDSARIRGWFQSVLGIRIPWYVRNEELVCFWNNRYIGGVLFQNDPELLFRVAGTPTSEPPRDPFQPRPAGDAAPVECVFMTNRTQGMMSYEALRDTINPNDSSSCPFTMGYTDLWVLEPSVVLERAGELRPWRRAQRHDGVQGPWLVLVDPQFTPWLEPHSSDLILADAARAEDALQIAEEFNRTYGAAVLVAQIKSRHFWH